MFDWDEQNVRHIATHGIRPQEAEEAFLDPNAVTRETGVYDDEYREALIGITRRGRLVLVIIAERGRLFRVVSAYEATGREETLYFRR